jgi:hypothetical protein
MLIYGFKMNSNFKNALSISKLNVYNLLVCLLLMTVLISCKKSESPDYRDKYLGDFNFRVISDSWIMYKPPVEPDTQFFKGEIKKFVNDSIGSNGYIVDTDKESLSKKITVYYLTNRKLSFSVNVDGQLSKAFPGNYHLQRGILKKDTVSFRLTNASGLGGGFSIDVIGIRRND